MFLGWKLGIRNSKFVRAAMAMAIVFAASTAAYAQGCAICYTSAAAAKKAAIQALRSGILILLVPSALMFIGIFALGYRRRNRFIETDSEKPDLDRELTEWLAGMDVRREYELNKSGVRSQQSE